MCGIIGYKGFRDANEVAIKGLKKLEYRGYDSWGVALRINGELKLIKKVGKIGEECEDCFVDNVQVDGTIAVIPSISNLGLFNIKNKVNPSSPSAKVRPNPGSVSNKTLMENKIKYHIIDFSFLYKTMTIKYTVILWGFSFIGWKDFF